MQVACTPLPFLPGDKAQNDDTRDAGFRAPLAVFAQSYVAGAIPILPWT